MSRVAGPDIRTPSQLIAFLNAIEVGEVNGIHDKIELARQACLELDLPDLADKLAEAGDALRAADMKTYRKRIETVIARLGHLR